MINHFLSLLQLELEIVNPVLKYVIDTESLLPLLRAVLVGGLQLFDLRLLLFDVLIQLCNQRFLTIELNDV